MIEQREAMAAHPICVALASQVRKAAFKAVEYSGNDESRGARIHLCDLADLEIRACEVSGPKIIHCWAGNHGSSPRHHHQSLGLRRSTAGPRPWVAPRA